MSIGEIISLVEQSQLVLLSICLMGWGFGIALSHVLFGEFELTLRDKFIWVFILGPTSGIIAPIATILRLDKIIRDSITSAMERRKWRQMIKKK